MTATSPELPATGAGPRLGWRLFALSFTALFLELMVIRWAPSELRLIAYYANLLLVSSFLGLGLGAMLTARDWRLFRFFPLFLAASIALLLCAEAVKLPVGNGEWRFATGGSHLSSYLLLVLVFLLNALTFVPLGEEIGREILRQPPLRAYSWDLAGSLAGTLCFGLFSFVRFSPLVGLALVMGLVLLISPPRQRGWSLPVFGLILAALALTQRPHTLWSPYYFITINENDAHATAGSAQARMVERSTDTPPPDLRTMRDPPIYTVRVNQDFYQMHGSVDPTRYEPGGWRHQLITQTAAQYTVPYHLIKPPARVLVLGGGGGMDVEAALLQGARRVDVVEIDPVLPALSNRFSSSAPYRDPRVVLHVDDARAFLQRNQEQFDLVAFGYLDSQALFSYGASLRLDGYIYTVESFRQAYAGVRENGAMAVWFYAGSDWMAQKLVQMVEQATGLVPLVYVRGPKVVVIAPKGRLQSLPAEIADWQLIRAARTPVDLATDDWPYLYLERRGIPADYALVIGILLAVSLAVVLGLRGTGFAPNDRHFLFLGWGFLLLQTKSISDCSLYFGTTWVVTTLIITGVLLMVLLANWLALRFVRAFSLWLYAPLFASLVLLLAVPRELILGQDMALRVLWTLLVVPLPVFFAGLIFSTSFKDTVNPAALFGANLLGATIGGFCEYLGMWTGSHALGYLVIAAYAGSLISRLQLRAGPAPAGQPRVA